MGRKAGVFQRTYTAADILTDSNGTYLPIPHGLGNPYPVGYLYTKGGNGQFGNPFAIVSVDSDNAKFYTGPFGDPYTLTLVG